MGGCTSVDGASSWDLRQGQQPGSPCARAGTSVIWAQSAVLPSNRSFGCFFFFLEPTLWRGIPTRWWVSLCSAQLSWLEKRYAFLTLGPSGSGIYLCSCSMVSVSGVDPGLGSTCANVVHGLCSGPGVHIPHRELFWALVWRGRKT